MNQYKLSYTGPEVDNLLGKAGTAITPESESLSPATQTAIRNNINAASKDVETVVASHTSQINEINNTTIPVLQTTLSSQASAISSLQTQTSSLPGMQAQLSTANGDIVVNLGITAAEYLNIARQTAEPYSASSTYFVGRFCSRSSVIYKCISTISTPEAWNSSHWSRLG